MKGIELYDIIKLDNNEEYTISAKLVKNNKMYLMLIGVDEEENPIPEKSKVVELVLSNLTIKEIEDKEELKLISLELSKDMLKELNS